MSKINQKKMEAFDYVLLYELHILLTSKKQRIVLRNILKRLPQTKFADTKP